MKFFSFLFLIFILSIKLSAQTGIKDCRVLPPFVSKIGYDLTKSAFSTSEKKNMGICFIELSENGANKVYQQPSWKKAGYLSAIAITEKGEVFTVPTPVINVLYNKPEEQNSLYRLHPQTGELQKVASFPSLAKPNEKNPFGFLGLAYDCDSKILYASSIMGSTQDEEKGVVFAIQLPTYKVLDKIENIDVMGIGVIRKGEEKRLMLGKIREGAIVSVTLKSDGTFNKNLEAEFSLDGIGERGDDVARKIRMGIDGTLTITGTQFYYNLTAPTEKPDTKYILKYFDEQKQWKLLQIQ